MKYMTSASMTPEEEAAMRAALTKAARADKRAVAATQKTRDALRAAILEATAKGMRPNQIMAATERRYTDGHLSRVINGKA